MQNLDTPPFNAELTAEDVARRLEALRDRQRAGLPATNRLGENLVARGLVTLDDLERALELQQARGLRIGEMLVAIGALSSADLAEALADHLGVPYVELDGAPPDPMLSSLIPEAFARRYRMLAVEHTGEHIVIAMADPKNVFALDDLKVLTGRTVTAVLADAEELSLAINRTYDASTIENTMDDATNDLDVEDQDEIDDISETEAPLIRLVSAMFEQAVADRATDIHVEPGVSTVRIRMRIDGVLHDRSEAPLAMLRSLIVRLKVLSGLDIAQKRTPQDGRFSLTVGGRPIDVRIATLPTAAGESAVLRILDPERTDVTLSSLGLSATEHDRLVPHLHARQGAIIVTGPTGAGKTTTLYAMLQDINSREKNIVSIEDPVEYVIDGVKQIQVNNRANMTFPSALRSVLRADPDVVLVGEVRDTETARIAMSASITGHLVLSSLHTTSAAAAAMRLADMGTESYLVSSALTCVVSQRLARRLCDRCAREVHDPDLALFSELGAPESLLQNALVRAPVGCTACRGTGYHGRIPIFEIMPLTDRIRRLIVERATTFEIENVAVEEGMDTLRLAALRRVVRGELSVDEMLRIAS